MIGKVQGKMEQYPIHTIEPEAADVTEQVGTKYKFWFKEDGEDYLFKEGRTGTGENWAEVACAEICTLLNLPHASYQFGQYEEKKGVISKNFVPKDGRLVLGNEVLYAATKGYPKHKRFRQNKHTVRLVTTVLQDPDKVLLPEEWEHPKGIKTAAELFLGYLMLDAIVGNTDRHHENWGLISFATEQLVFLAPTFDHASSLGRELTDDKRELRLTTNDKRQTILHYASKTRSALYKSPSSETPLSPISAFLEASSILKSAKAYWLDVLKNLNESDIKSIFDKIPNSEISETSKMFAISFVMLNTKTLLEEAEKHS